jgi:uracil phosphoribosyltransferase
MEVFVLNNINSIANQFLLELRDTKIQTDRMRFRNNLTRLGEIMAYEISKKLEYKSQSGQTPLQSVQISTINQQPVIITVLRAGLPYFQGFLNYFDRADSGFIGAYRKEGGDEITINLEYLAAPDLDGRPIILVDPMLATGNSFVRSVAALQKHGTPSHIFLASLIASPEGIRNIEQNIPVPFSLWTAAIDEKLNHNFYIVPGLGDAGDLSFGSKL